MSCALLHLPVRLRILCSEVGFLLFFTASVIFLFQLPPLLYLLPCSRRHPVLLLPRFIPQNFIARILPSLLYLCPVELYCLFTQLYQRLEPVLDFTVELFRFLFVL
ncbi:hypothetical protein DPMN_100238 [Dreissena polymorpha]|uniref:Uncharacterized protein n=1 Tax=Dreissena polymorpha TaxID=45954 RepID=A0A9D4R8H1_DREPO|nr:hypothetical protein DPMN_100238 [Dreissena polymorpha]